MVGLLFFYQSITGHWESRSYAWALVAPTAPGLGQILYGTLKGRPETVKTGKDLTRVGLAIFVVAAVFFELIIGIGVFGYILLFGLDNTPLRRVGRISSGAWQTEPIKLAVDGVQTADVDIQIGPPGANLYALEDSSNLIEGQVTYTDDLLFETSQSKSARMPGPPTRL